VTQTVQRDWPESCFYVVVISFRLVFAIHLIIFHKDLKMQWNSDEIDYKVAQGWVFVPILSSVPVKFVTIPNHPR